MPYSLQCSTQVDSRVQLLAITPHKDTGSPEKFCEYQLDNKRIKKGWKWWLMSIIPATSEGGTQDDHGSKPAWAKS
jgi:hypothetical protein